MKKIISIVLVLVCAFALFSCEKEDATEIAIKEINEMYVAISPTKIITKTTQEFGDYKLIGTTSLIVGTVDGNAVAVYESQSQKLRDVESGSGNEVISPIEDLGKITKEYHEELGYRENGGKWDANGEDFTPETGANALALTKDTVNDFKIDAEKKEYSFTVLAANTEAVFGYAIASDVSVIITHSGADITGVVLTYVVGSEDHPEIKVTVEASYSYDSETITIQ